MTRDPSSRRAARIAIPTVLGSLLLFVATAAFPQAPTGEGGPPPFDSTSAAYRLGVAFLGLLAMPGGEADARFVHEHLGEEWLRGMNADSTANWFALMRRQSGGVTVERAETMGSMAVFHATTRDGGRRARMIFGGHDRDSSRLAFIAVVPDVRQYASEPPALPDRRMPTDSVMMPVLQLLEWAAAHDLFTGTAIIKRGDRIVLDHSYGLANRATGRVNSLPMRYHTGSWGKMMVAVAIGQLVDRGKLRFEDTLARVLPEYPNREVAKRVTIHHLLTHTSGLGGLFDRQGWTVAHPFVRQADLFPLFAAEPLGFEPGAETGYSNEGYVVLGAVVEKLSGRRLAEYLERNVWRPAKMEETCDCLPLHGMDLRAIGYASFEDRDP
ncbi:MAG: serine hydrolase domain-containing protein, partial [Tepidiformaceae bacterium]